MGGNVAVVVRKENGEQINMSRWTNAMPYYLSHPDLYTGNKEKWLDIFSEEWLKMKEDYEKNKDTGDFEYNMTSVYFPFNNFAPDEYGLIVVDLQKNKIYSTQDYCAVGKVSLYNVFSKFRENDEEFVNFKKLWDAGYIKTIASYDFELKKDIEIDISKLNFEELIDFMKESFGNRNNENNENSHPLLAGVNKELFQYFSISFPIKSDWDIYASTDRYKGLLDMRKLLKKDGFTFTEEDDEIWKEYLSFYFSNSNDEDFKQLYLEEFPENEKKYKLK